MDARHSLGDLDIYLFKQGRHTRLYEHFGAHPESLARIPLARGSWSGRPTPPSVSVIGDFNAWDRTSAPMSMRADSSGVWECFVPGARHGQRYKYHLSWPGGEDERADPFALFCEQPPATASIIWDLGYVWEDHDWMKVRQGRNALESPWSVYEVHLGSWRRDEHGNFMNYRQMAHELADYVKDAGLHPCGDHARGRTSVLWFLGLSEHGLFRALPAATAVRRISAISSIICTRRASASSWTGCQGISPRISPRAGQFRRHGPVRTRRSAPGLSPRMEKRHLQLRPVRGGRLSDLQRHVLDAGVSSRRPARRWSGLHAVPGLFAPA
jgi:hypothetical protein